MRISCFVIAFMLCVLFAPVSAGTAFAAHRIGGVARLKGQETTTLSGFGIVTGLNGKGDKGDFGTTSRMLGTMLALNGAAGSTAKELATSKNIALVRVQVTVPAAGAREGDYIDCTVSAVGTASSLEGGVLAITQLIGPIPNSDVERTMTFGWAEGQITIEKDTAKTVGKITNGCRLTDDFRNPYIDPKTGNITLVLADRFAKTPQMAVAVAKTVNDWGNNHTEGDIATAVDSKNIVIRMPKSLLKDPMVSVAEIMDAEINLTGSKIPTVKINERTESIVIDEGVEIEPVSISIKGIDILAAPPGPNGQASAPPQRFVPLDVPAKMPGGTQNAKLRALNDALNEVKVPTKDIIAIFKELDKSGHIHGVVEYDR